MAAEIITKEDLNEFREKLLADMTHCFWIMFQGT